MAGQIKRLRRKTTVSQSACSELLLLTSEWWMQFVLPLGRYEPRVYAIFWMKKWRLLSKSWREVWDQGFRVKLSLDQSHVLELCSVAFHSGVLGDLLFCRDRASKIIYYHVGLMHGGTRCDVSMPWKTFKTLRSLLLQIARPTDWIAVSVLSFIQTAFCFQREL